MKKFTLFAILLPFLFSASPDRSMPIKTTTLAISGDVMVHKLQLTRAYRNSNVLFDFDSSFQYVAPFFRRADIALANLETTVAGEDNALGYVPNTYFKGYQGFNYFNSPESILSALGTSGFDILSTANNHSMDSGLLGAATTWTKVLEYGMVPLGTQPKGDTPTRYITSNGITMALLSYTFSTNGIAVPPGNFEINSLDFYKPKMMAKMERQVNESQKQSDFVIIMIHFGSEYVHTPTQTQKDIVDKLFFAGADIVLGSHPHVLQPIEFKKIDNPDGTERTGMVIYSLGNLLSAQRYPNPEMKSKDAGVILNLTLAKQGRNHWISAVSIIPTWVQLTADNFTILPIDHIAGPSAPPDMCPKDVKRIAAIKKESIDILSRYCEERPVWNGIGYEIAIPAFDKEMPLESADIYREF